MKRANTSQGLGGTEPVLSRSQSVTQHLVKFHVFVPEWLATLSKQILKGHTFMECTSKSKANDIDFKHKNF